MRPALSALLLAASASLLVGATSPARERHQNFELVGRAFKGIQDQAKKRPPNLVALRNTTAVLATLASRVKTWFPAGSRSEDTLPAAWTNRAELDRRADAFTAASNSLVAAAESGNTARIQAAIRATGETCKGCHDLFRKK